MNHVSISTPNSSAPPKSVPSFVWTTNPVLPIPPFSEHGSFEQRAQPCFLPLTYPSPPLSPPSHPGHSDVQPSSPHASPGHLPWCIHPGDSAWGEDVGGQENKSLKEQPRQRKEVSLPWGFDKTNMDAGPSSQLNPGAWESPNLTLDGNSEFLRPFSPWQVATKTSTPSEE